MQALFLTTNKRSDIFQFNLLSSFNLIKQWNPPKSCEKNEFIHNIAYNNGTLALIIKTRINYNNSKNRTSIINNTGSTLVTSS